MTMKRTPRPRDPVQLGKLMVDIITGQVPDAVDDGKSFDAVERGKAGGVIGGKQRSAKMSADERSQAATRAAAARWAKRPQ